MTKTEEPKDTEEEQDTTPMIETDDSDSSSSGVNCPSLLLFGVNVLKRTSSSYVQNMIHNMILTSCSNKSFIVASCGGYVALFK